jgi:hypothetical protein
MKTREEITSLIATKYHALQCAERRKQSVLGLRAELYHLRQDLHWHDLQRRNVADAAEAAACQAKIRQVAAEQQEEQDRQDRRQVWLQSPAAGAHLAIVEQQRLLASGAARRHLQSARDSLRHQMAQARALPAGPLTTDGQGE